MCVVTSPDNRCHFIVATAGPKKVAGSGTDINANSNIAVAVAGDSNNDHGTVALEWCVNGRMVL